MVRPLHGLVLHVQSGTQKGTDAWFHNPKAQVSAHFGIPLSGRPVQWVDTDDKAWAEAGGNPSWISVELEGYADHGPAPTHSQIEWCAHLLAWLRRHEEIPLRKADHPDEPGLGWHGMGGAAWGNHPSCPGDKIKAARHDMLRLAREIAAG